MSGEEPVPREGWRPWFAWRPVTLKGGGTAFLRVVERRRRLLPAYHPRRDDWARVWEHRG